MLDSKNLFPFFSQQPENNIQKKRKVNYDQKVTIRIFFLKSRPKNRTFFKKILKISKYRTILFMFRTIAL